MNDGDRCGNGTAHMGINKICSTCDQPKCLARHEQGFFCMKSLGHAGDHENPFLRAKEIGPWEDVDYLPVELTEEEIEEAKKWQKEMDELMDGMLGELIDSEYSE